MGISVPFLFLPPSIHVGPNTLRECVMVEVPEAQRDKEH